MDRVQTGHQLFFSATEVQEKLFTSSISSTSTVLFFMLNQWKLLLTFTFALSCKSMRFVQRVTVKRGGGFSCIIFKQKKVLSCLRFLFTTGCMSFFPISFCPIFLQGTFFFQSMYRCTQVRVIYEFDRNSNTLA